MSEPARPPAPPELWPAPPRGRVLAVAPHPDDETLGLGGTLAAHAQAGDEVDVLVVCSGVEGDPEGYFDREELPALREAECREACRILGVREVEFLGYPDGLSGKDLHLAFPEVPQEADAAREMLARSFADLLAARVRDRGHEILYLPWEGELNPDHWVVARSLPYLRAHHAEVVEQVSVLGYDVWSSLPPDTVVDISDQAGVKDAALGVYRTQQLYRDHRPFVRGLDAYRAILLERGATFAEAFTGHYRRREPAYAPEDRP